MNVLHPKLKPIVAVFALIVMNSLPLAAEGADETDETLLLEQLATADKATARRLDRQLQAMWRKSGSAAMDLLLDRGRDAMKVSNWTTAIEHLTALTDHAPGFAEGWHARANAFYEKGMYGPAMADLERALALNPNNYDAIFGLGAILETFGDDKRAYEAYRRVLAIHPHHEDVTKALERLKTRVEGQSL